MYKIEKKFGKIECNKRKITMFSVFHSFQDG